MAVNEREHLIQADRHIADCKAHIARQRQIIQRGKKEAHDVQWAEELLGCFEASLRTLEGHRQLILERLRWRNSNDGKNRIMIYGPKDDDGTFVVEFRTSEGEALAISIPRSETAVIRHFQERMPYGLYVPDEA